MSGPFPVKIVNVDHLDGDTVLVELSDDTLITLTLPELLALRPQREPPPEPDS